MQLWFTEGNLPRFFLFPEGFVPERGGLRLENTLGEYKRVTPGSVEEHEVELTEARKWFESNVEAIEAVRDAKRAQIEKNLPQLDAMAKALEAGFDDQLVARELIALGLNADGILDIERGHAFAEDLIALVRRSNGAPDPEALRKVFRKHGHKDANRLLRGDEATLARLNKALARLIRH